MKLDDDYDSYSSSRFKSTAIGVGIAIIVAVLLFMLIINADSISENSRNNKTASAEISYSASEIEDDFVLSSSSLRPADLDFFEMYPKESVISDSSSLATPIDGEVEEEDPSKDGKHTLLKFNDGTEEWVEISKYIKLNDYDYTNLQNQDGIMEYLDKGKVISSFGVDVSKDQGYIDYIKLRKAGVDFVMIRVGARGYTSGQITLDDYFQDNIKRATDAGLGVGVYFLSQAISEEEAEEEAAIVLENIKDYRLDYPVGYIMSYAENENSRVETLTRNEKTMIARAFLKKIDEEGYKPVLYGDKVWLIKYLELAKIASDFDIWLSEMEDYPSFPYRFTMWQYSTNSEIAGIKGKVNFNISLVDYTLR